MVTIRSAAATISRWRRTRPRPGGCHPRAARCARRARGSSRRERGWRRRPSARAPCRRGAARPASSPGGRGPSRCGRHWRDRPAGRWSTRLPGRLPVPLALAEILPLLLGPLVEALAEVGARWLVQALAERVREELGQLLRIQL